MEVGFWAGVLRGGSEKGSTRKDTGNWVTRWRSVVWGNFRAFTLNCEENLVGGIWIWDFLEFWSVFHVRLLRRGDT
jgi:hypothetical protein